ncbi:hypothetical protein AMS68_003184 [Peltaster fructicola]|uniref:Uncharacterized protein n=1 Tax=Peltaster fructicola TaxID=286661 RepID=A0A6H0XSC7_9PEZI|nr:hypothetical protein AMS68_003184 [Peltaster fructicola]
MRADILLLVLGIQRCLAEAADLHGLGHANHLFNAVHSAMRQWGSSLLHNGMTAFIATVPADTEFYHGTSSKTGLTAQNGPPPGRGLPPGRQTPDTADNIWCIPGRPCAAHPRDHQDFSGRGQQSLHMVNDEVGHGYLHTYRTKHSLRLLYVDGQSAAKSTKGTLDMQDVVILREQLPSSGGDDGKGHSGPMFEHERAEALCNRARKEWRGNIDGILRMEGGFEIILCSFEDHLDIVSIKQTQETRSRMLTGDPNIAPPPEKSNDMMHYYKAVAARYDGIGGQRVSLQYDRFVSLYAYPGAIYYDDNDLPRARNGTASLEEARNAIDNMVLSSVGQDAFNWQAISDMVVARYADAIDYLTSGQLGSLSQAKEEIEHALRPFINYSARDNSEEIERCTAQFFPWTLSLREHTTPIAGAAIQAVSHTICQELSRASQMHSLEDITSTLKHLKGWLGWTTWKRCRGCKVNEVCFLPIWPRGTAEDFESPQCKSSLERSRGQGSYWND